MMGDVKRWRKLIFVLSAVVVLVGALTVWLYLGQLEERIVMLTLTLKAALMPTPNKKGITRETWLHSCRLWNMRGLSLFWGLCAGAANSPSCTKTRQCIGSG